MAIGQGAGCERQCGGGYQLPPENGEYRLSQGALHGVVFYARAKPTQYSLRPLTGSICCNAANRSGVRSTEFAEQRIELVERGVVQHELAAARLGPCLYLYRGPQPLAPFLLEARHVPIGPGTRRAAAPGEGGNQVLDVAHRELLASGEARNLDLLQRGQAQESAHVAHV